MKRIALVIFLFATNAAYANIPDCSDLTGDWQGSFYDYEIESLRTWHTFFSQDGTFTMEFEDNFGSKLVNQKESGEWYCNKDDLHILTRTVDDEAAYYHDIYKLLNLDTTYMRFQHVIADCVEYNEEHQGDIFEAVKVD